MEPLVSVIVPVYNAEAGLNRCVDSILKQDYRNLELILVDDGSRDRSGAICDEYAAQDARVCVIHKENSGVSDTRNMALDRAQGKYVQFLDSDDWITPDATRLLVSTAEEEHADLVIADFYRVSGDRVAQKGDIEESTVMSRAEFAAHMMENPADFYYGVIWNKLYRRDIIERGHLRMEKDLSWCEDFLFNLEYLRHVKRVAALAAPVYYYVRTKGSLAVSPKPIAQVLRMKLNLFERYNDFYKDIYDEEDYEDKRLAVYRFFFSSAKDGFVAPAIASTRLGEERTRIEPAAIADGSRVFEPYRSRKMLDRFCETAAKKNNLTLNEALSLLCVRENVPIGTAKRLAEYVGCTERAAASALNGLAKKKLVSYEMRRNELLHSELLSCGITAAALPVLEDLDAALRNYDALRFDGMTQAERELCMRAEEKIRENFAKAIPTV